MLKGVGRESHGNAGTRHMQTGQTIRHTAPHHTPRTAAPSYMRIVARGNQNIAWIAVRRGCGLCIRGVPRAILVGACLRRKMHENTTKGRLAFQSGFNSKTVCFTLSSDNEQFSKRVLSIFILELRRVLHPALAGTVCETHLESQFFAHACLPKIFRLVYRRFWRTQNLKKLGANHISNHDLRRILASRDLDNVRAPARAA